MTETLANSSNVIIPSIAADSAASSFQADARRLNAFCPYELGDGLL